MSVVGAQALTPQRKWLAITVATLLLVPAFWALLAGLVSDALEEEGGPEPAAAVALGLAVIPFVYVALAFLSAHRSAPMAVLKAMALTILVGAPVSVFAGDAVTGIVAGIGAGGVVALRADEGHTWRARALGVVVAAAYTFVIVRAAGSLALLTAPVLPLTAIGVADHLTERR